MFRDRESAERAYQSLSTRGYSERDVNLAMAEDTLVGWGIPEERVKHYEEGIKQGGIVMGITPRSDEDAEYIEREWKNNCGEHVYR